MSTGSTFAKLERLIAELDAGKHDDVLPAPAQVPVPAVPMKFSDVKPFDVRAWAERKGIKLPKPQGPSVDGG